jgi:tetratricopeptide (TPR) repeat protein
MALELKIYCYICLGNNDQAIIAAEESLAFTENRFKENKDINIAKGMCLILNVYMLAGKYESGLRLAERFAKEYPFEFGSNILCNAVVSVLYLTNQQIDKAEVLIQKARNSGADFEMLSHLYLSFAAEILSNWGNTNYKLAMKYIDLTLVNNPNNFKGQFYKFLLSILIKDQTATNNTFQSIELDLQSDMSVVKDLLKEPIPATTSSNIADTSEIDNNHEADNFIEEKQIRLEAQEYDPIKIHQFFQKEKARLLNESLSVLLPKPKTKWKVGRLCFEEGMEGLIRIHHPRFSFCYAIIHPSLNPPFLEKFTHALSNSDYENTSKVSRKKNSNVQTLNNSLVQLKISKDNRLWTDKVYHVDSKYLIVFDNNGSHSEVKRKVREGKLKVINLSEHQPSLLNPGNNGIFATPPANTSENQNPVEITNNL